MESPASRARRVGSSIGNGASAVGLGESGDGRQPQCSNFGGGTGPGAIGLTGAFEHEPPGQGDFFGNGDSGVAAVVGSRYAKLDAAAGSACEILEH